MDQSALLLELYRAAREQSAGSFEEHAIGLLKSMLDFDSAIWGNGLLRGDHGVTPHVVHLHRQPHEALREWANINVQDPVAAKCFANPGKAIRCHAPTLFAKPHAAAMRDYARRYGRQSYMVCGMKVEAQPEFLAWLSLYRCHPDAQFSEAERALYSQLMAHLHEALQINRRLQLRRAFEAEEPEEALAIADLWGYLHVGPQNLHVLLSAEWSHVPSGRLPQPLLDFLAATPDGSYRGRAICVRSRSVGGMLFVRVRRRASLDGLSSRELQVARAVACGLSAKEIGKALGVAPSTVRVHIGHIYEKLGLHSQAELAYLLGQTHSDIPASDRVRERQPVIREGG